MIRRGRPSACERGSATVLGTVLIGVLAVVTVMVAVVGGAVTDQRRLEAAVDLGALAGASATQRGADACAAAGEVTAGNGARVTACSVVGDVVTVRAGWVTERVLGLRLTLTATARAGPESALTGSVGLEAEPPGGGERQSGEFPRGSWVRG